MQFSTVREAEELLQDGSVFIADNIEVLIVSKGGQSGHRSVVHLGPIGGVRPI